MGGAISISDISWMLILNPNMVECHQIPCIRNEELEEIKKILRISQAAKEIKNKYRKFTYRF